VFIHCMDGWRMVFCWLDNLVPHKDTEDGAMVGRLGFGWVCRLHDAVGYYGE
jgi:hypothetical protein